MLHVHGKRMTFAPEKPFNDLPDLPPDSTFSESREIIQLTIEARTALAELKGTCRTLPNPDIFLETISLQESKDSSEIENIVTTQDELFQADALSGISSSWEGSGPAKEVLRYRLSMKMGMDKMNANGLITTNLLVSIQQQLRNTEAGIRQQMGTVISNPESGTIIYTPPSGEALIRKKLAALEVFIHENEELDPVICLALIHYQFEAIHPFYDDNGRTGRILNVLYLIQRGLLEHPVLYLSRYILLHRSEYYTRLQAVTEQGDWAGWVSFMLTGVRETSKWTLASIIQLNEMIDDAAHLSRSKMKSGYSRELIDLIFKHPYCKIGHLVDAGIAGRVTASRYLNQLEELGILTSIQIHRDKYFINTAIMRSLDVPLPERND